MNKLDRAIAEQIMGYEFIELRYFAHDASPRQMELEGWFGQFAPRLHVGDHYINVEKDICIPVEEFAPSTNMQHAWQVVTELRRRGFETYIRPRGSKEMPVWECEITDEVWHVATQHREAQVAICQAIMLFRQDRGI